ncbi:hypothetical protein BDP81DRAFT_20405 [Colletotrichum phormii]|uniref:Uncharacterized protein n=1 Tax=Colletotrichum phormii TaxID=359342 RepID=A0AAJ0A4L9_9PEZI|nr:uncharacterized protein BDP81DRAFT_20405 [Colletotrichum phormii]KAK1656375.1 hypothetical protein BDP81DRAFT_20405 [Colletotrichum phormii]
MELPKNLLTKKHRGVWGLRISFASPIDASFPQFSSLSSRGRQTIKKGNQSLTTHSLFSVSFRRPSLLMRCVCSVSTRHNGSLYVVSLQWGWTAGNGFPHERLGGPRDDLDVRTWNRWLRIASYPECSEFRRNQHCLRNSMVSTNASAGL